MLLGGGGELDQPVYRPTPPLRKNRRRGPLLWFFVRGRGRLSVHRLGPDSLLNEEVTDIKTRVASKIVSLIIRFCYHQIQNIKQQQQRQKQNKYDDPNITIKEQRLFKHQYGYGHSTAEYSTISRHKGTYTVKLLKMEQIQMWTMLSLLMGHD